MTDALGNDATAELPVVIVGPAPDETDTVPEAGPPDASEPEDVPAVPTSEPEPPPAAAPVVVVAAEIASHAAPRRRRRWPWITLVVVVLALAAAVGAGLWYISGLIGAGAAVPQPDDGYPLSIVSAEGASVAYSGPNPWHDVGLAGVTTIEGGYLQTDDPVAAGSGVASRVILDAVLPPAPAVGEATALDSGYFPRNPRVGLGVDYQDVLYDSPLGPTPAWFIPGTSSTWVLFTHGRGASPLEGLRIASTVTQLGYPMLLIKYRDDAKAPAEDGLGNFGATEWPDLEAAVQYALDHGAEHIVLSGASMGGAISLAFLQNSPLADTVTGAFLDSPLSNFSQVVEISGQDMGLPGFAIDLGMRTAALRYGFDWAATDYTAGAADFTTPILIVQGTADTTAPPAVNEDFAAAANPDVVTLEVFEGAGHVQSWNVDRPRYEQLLTDFLVRIAR